VIVAAAAAAFAIHKSREPQPDAARRRAPAATLAGESTILPGDYVGPDACKECHEEKYAQWRAHPHSKMNRDATGETVRGDFSGVRVPYEDGTVLFARDGDRYTMTLERAGAVVREYRVTRTVGSRFMQFYIGVESKGPPGPDEAVRREQEQKLPFGYWFKLHRWLPTSYFDPVGPETQKDGTPVYDPYNHPRVHLWSQNCMLCHNTYAFAYRLGLPNGLSGFPAQDLLVAGAPLVSELQRSLATEGPTVRERIRPKNLVSLGVSCESCHFGGREHVKNERESKPLPTSPYLKFTDAALARTDPDKKDPYAVNHVCAQCHRAVVTLFPNGAGTWNSREALDLMGGACQNAIGCTDCHDPHKAGGPEAAEGRDPASAATCVRCHAKLASPEAARAHSKHSEKVNCLDCHMPRVTQGLEEVVRTHRIASPAEASMLAAGSANACNLCHLDRSIRFTLDALEKDWGKKIVPGPEWARAYGGSLETPVGKVWLSGPDQSMRLVAAQAYGRSPLGGAALPDLVRALDDPVAVNRVFAGFAIERVRGRPLAPEEFDPTAPSETRRRQIDAILGAAVK
jgi:hypothetical protein